MNVNYANQDLEKSTISVKGQKLTDAEDLLYNVISAAFDMLDKTRSPLEQMTEFLTIVHLPTNDTLLTNGFIAAALGQSSLYNNVFANMQKIMGKSFDPLKEDRYKKRFAVIFHNWIDAYYPEAKEKYFKLAITSLFKVFARKVNETKIVNV